MNWISVKDRLPEVLWAPFLGSMCYSPQVVLLLRRLEFRGGSRLVVSVGEYDTTGIPAEWRTWDDYVNEEGYEDTDSRIVDDVTHWSYLPEPPECKHEWGSEEYSESSKAHYICNKCGGKLK